jgi:hypothetical protein
MEADSVWVSSAVTAMAAAGVLAVHVSVTRPTRVWERCWCVRSDHGAPAATAVAAADVNT